MRLACREVNSTNGQWDPWLLDIVSNETQISSDTLTAMGGPTFYDPNGKISLDSLSRIQDFWMQKGTVTNKVDVNAMVDTAPVAAVLRRIGTINT